MRLTRNPVGEGRGDLAEGFRREERREGRRKEAKSFRESMNGFGGEMWVRVLDCEVIGAVLKLALEVERSEGEMKKGWRETGSERKIGVGPS